ncbi:MAG: histidinol-phosphatase [Bacteroidetes bacterium HGW-Bacteroidetes-8]|jgi:hypothetical protein|nr:MAG: histidinol-phosphatase [Bacteroidetes bacterium HGW-Bacteroidetes-8]
MKLKILSLFALTLSLSICTVGVNGQNLNPNKVTYPEYSAVYRANFTFPQVNGYKVVVCDFHTHTMFSDGLVWPTLRVAEAWTGGLDALSITDHIEYRPYRKYTNNDHNTSYEIALSAARNSGLILIRGTEITRTQKTLGHYNALFIKDANPIAVEDPKASIVAAKNQGGFIIWNHPGWAVDTTYIKEFQADLFKDKLIDGIEVFNNSEFYPRVVSWAVDMGLTMIATSDVHGNVESGTLLEKGFKRPVTLVLAKEKSAEGIREALDNRRTVAWFQNMLAAHEDVAKQFVTANISVTKVDSDTKNNWINLTNNGSVVFKIRINKQLYTLPALSSIIVAQPLANGNVLKSNFENFFIYENKTLAHDLYFN